MRFTPDDWPGAGPIDLAVHDLPHRSSTTEWWYLHAHLDARFSVFAAFFRVRAGHHPGTQAPLYAHSVTWALCDLERKQNHPFSHVDRSAPRMGLETIQRGQGTRDARLNRAMTEILERNAVPAPDRMFSREAVVAEDRLALDCDGLVLERTEAGAYRLSLHREDVRCELLFTPQRQPVRHGDEGRVRGPGGEDMFYYFIPRCAVSGSVAVKGETREVHDGSGWYDHEFGGVPPAPQGQAQPTFELRHDVAWNWVALQLDDGTELSAYALDRADGGGRLHEWCIAVDAQGARSSHEGMTLEHSATFRSVRTFMGHPTRWRLRVPGADLDLEVEAALDDQEVITCISRAAFWEGRCKVRGLRAGKPISGQGYLERSGFDAVRDLDEFFGHVGALVRKSVQEMLPLVPTREEAQRLVASPERPHYLDGVEPRELGEALIAPIRAIVDRGGKSWRSYAALVSCDVVGGDARKFARWLAVPELLHVGSLIVDDVQDESLVRRGGPSCHAIYGEPLAINAGTAAYFLPQKILVESGELSDAQRLQIYDLYFEAMRAGHAGQALDLRGVSALMPEAIARGESAVVEQRILAIHRLKTAAPAAALARMGAVAGGARAAQTDALGGFFEAVGLAFQIVDDVLNLRGFKNDLKTRAEDISRGVVTLPVAKALSLLPLERREWLWQRLCARTSDPVELSSVVEVLEACGAIEACAAEARALVEDAWQAASPLLDDSLSKVMLRAFGWYVLERQY